MIILLITLCMICLCLAWLYLGLRREIRSLCGQLAQICRGSHMELAVGSRQRCLLTLCKQLNQILSARDAEYLLYQREERLLKQNIAYLAHDIRTPLTGASGYVQLAMECENADKIKHCLTAAQSRMEDLEDMLEKLFLYTKLAGEDFTLAPENRQRIQALPLLGECLLGFYAQFEKAGFAPEVSFESEDFFVFGEEEALRRIFLNLIQNALLHGSGGLRILQSSGEAPAHCPLRSTARSRTISPAGCLIFENPFPKSRPMDISQIFDRFYKADPARGRASSGLGLFIVRELMRKLGGEAMAETDNGFFRILLLFPEEKPEK